MIVRWMLQTVAVSVLLTLGAVAAERLCRVWGREARAVWGVAILGSVALPLVSLLQVFGLIGPFGGPTAMPAALLAPIDVLRPPAAAGARTLTIDVIIASVWVLASAGLTIRFALAANALGRRRATWRPTIVDGQPLLVSRDAGPAVVGFRVPAVVVPEWVLGLDASLRELVLRHEREHLERGDPKLLFGAVAAATLAPWNPLSWFQLYRLRAAMELDCDHRVLRAHPDARRYGSLLLAVAQRADRSELLVAALTESNSLLARRIAAMRRPISSFRLTQTALLATSAILATIVACEMQSPAQPRAAATKRAAPTVANGPFFEFQVEKPVKPASGSGFPRYPDVLRQAGVQGEVLAQFIVGPDGRADVESFKVLKSTHDLFTKSVRAALPQMRFEPAIVGGRAVRQLVQQPFSFSITQ
jgi:TonB family protein